MPRAINDFIGSEIVKGNKLYADKSAEQLATLRHRARDAERKTGAGLCNVHGCREARLTRPDGKVLRQCAAHVERSRERSALIYKAKKDKPVTD
jgi:hypothetical protein